MHRFKCRTVFGRSLTVLSKDSIALSRLQDWTGQQPAVCRSSRQNLWRAKLQSTDSQNTSSCRDTPVVKDGFIEMENSCTLWKTPRACLCLSHFCAADRAALGGVFWPSVCFDTCVSPHEMQRRDGRAWLLAWRQALLTVAHVIISLTSSSWSNTAINMPWSCNACMRPCNVRSFSTEQINQTANQSVAASVWRALPAAGLERQRSVDCSQTSLCLSDNDKVKCNSCQQSYTWRCLSIWYPQVNTHPVTYSCALTSSGLSLQIQTSITYETAPVTWAVILWSWCCALGI